MHICMNLYTNTWLPLSNDHWLYSSAMPRLYASKYGYLCNYKYGWVLHICLHKYQYLSRYIEAHVHVHVSDFTYSHTFVFHTKKKHSHTTDGWTDACATELKMMLGVDCPFGAASASFSHRHAAAAGGGGTAAGGDERGGKNPEAVQDSTTGLASKSGFSFVRLCVRDRVCVSACWCVCIFLCVRGWPSLTRRGRRRRATIARCHPSLSCHHQ